MAPPNIFLLPCLLQLPRLSSLFGLLALAALLGRLGAGLGVQHVVPPAKRTRVVADEALVVHVVVLGTGPEGHEVVQAPGKVVARVGVDGLPQPQHDPDVDCQDVQIVGEAAPDDGQAHSAKAEAHDFDRRRVLGREPEGRRVGVVDLVDVAVERAPVQRAVEPVVPGVFHDEEDGDLVGHLGPVRERHARVHAKVLAQGVEEPDLGEFDREVAEQHQLGALPLFLGCGDLGLEEGERISVAGRRKARDNQRPGFSISESREWCRLLSKEVSDRSKPIRASRTT